jgi:hypothetical protein
LSAALAVSVVAVAVVVLGAYLRWAVRPVIAAYRAGVTIGRRR